MELDASGGRRKGSLNRRLHSREQLRRGTLRMRTLERSRRARLDAVARRGESVWREIETEIERTLSFEAQQRGEINAVRVSGGAHLTSAVRLGATNAFNGDKVIPIPPM